VIGGHEVFSRTILCEVMLYYFT